ncbi:MAG: glycogen debranching protein GlgX [Chlamydiota bacterium]
MNNQENNTAYYHTGKGYPLPLGPHKFLQGVNFAVFSKNATGVELCFFEHGYRTPCLKFKLDPLENKTGDVWHILIKGLPDTLLYAYRVEGPSDPLNGHRFDPDAYLLDPYSKAVNAHKYWGEKNQSDPDISTSVIASSDNFNWGSVHLPCIPLKDLILYEMHLRGFTQSPTSDVQHPGTFLGVIEKIPYLKELGINAVELLPIQSFNELECHEANPLTGNPLVNYWGYSTLNFFAPMSRYAFDSHLTSAITEFKTMVKALHQEGIEVILDVVFNHTAEGNENGPTLSYRGLENSVYYTLDSEGNYLNYSGCGNTFNCNHPVVRNLIHDCLRYWVTEMHVDGFRFDLASILGRDCDGTPLKSPPLIERISMDPVLADTKLIAEAWDLGGLYQVGNFFPEIGPWAEWNGQYRDSVRSYLKGDPGVTSAFTTRIAGSQDLYGSSRTPAHSINFITCHDGFSLRDLVSYNHKHNLANGENNRDGSDLNLSWNCGAEGPTDDKDILALRERQTRNFFLALLTSLGVPMITMGDEYGHTKNGNNNTWCQDSEINWFNWKALQDNQGLFRFVKKLIAFRKKHSCLHRNDFLTDSDVEWLDVNATPKNWEDNDSFLAWVLKSSDDATLIYVAFNPSAQQQEISLPLGKWSKIIDTSQSSPNDFITEGLRLESPYLTMAPYSSILAITPYTTNIASP